MKTVAFVPIKLNSQRLPNKNILDIAGKPLCWHICQSLVNVKGIDEIYVYCSNENVKQYIPKEVRFKEREKWLDGDLVKGFDIYSKFTEEVEADIYILAHTTSPFIKSTSIENALDKIKNHGYDSAFSAEKIQTFAWYKDKPINYDLNDVPRTQDMEPLWVETSGFYMFNKDIFTTYKRRIGFNPYIQEVTGIEAIDIDEKKDYDLACNLISLEEK